MLVCCAPLRERRANCTTSEASAGLLAGRLQLVGRAPPGGAAGEVELTMIINFGVAAGERRQQQAARGGARIGPRIQATINARLARHAACAARAA